MSLVFCSNSVSEKNKSIQQHALASKVTGAGIFGVSVIYKGIIKNNNCIITPGLRDVPIHL